MKNYSIISEVRQVLKDSADEKTFASAQNFFKEKIKLHGVKVPLTHKIAKQFYDNIKTLQKKDIFTLCGELWASGYMEESFVACDWSYSIHKEYKGEDILVFEKWLDNHVNNWASCDTLCNHTIGEFMEMFPENVGLLKKWAVSDNRWVRRAAAVTLIVPARKGLFLDNILEISDTLLSDGDDLVQKGYGWLLKAASMSESTAAAKKTDPETKGKHLETVFGYIMSKKEIMPRTALRYAIEKMPRELKAAAMAK